MVSPIEQRRRDFKGAEPDLYEYIAQDVEAKTLDRAGDLASGTVDGHGAANRLWRAAVAAKLRRDGAP